MVRTPNLDQLFLQCLQGTSPFDGEVLVYEGDGPLAREQVQDIGAQMTEPLVVLPARLQIALYGVKTQGGIPIGDQRSARREKSARFN